MIVTVFVTVLMAKLHIFSKLYWSVFIKQNETIINFYNTCRNKNRNVSENKTIPTLCAPCRLKYSHCLSASFFQSPAMADSVLDTCFVRFVIHNPIKHEAVCSSVLFRFISLQLKFIWVRWCEMWRLYFAIYAESHLYTSFLSTAVGGIGASLPVSTPCLDERLHELSK